MIYSCLTLIAQSGEAKPTTVTIHPSWTFSCYFITKLREIQH